jgi:hypothetical protein
MWREGTGARSDVAAHYPHMTEKTYSNRIAKEQGPPPGAVDYELSLTD